MENAVIFDSHCKQHAIDLLSRLQTCHAKKKKKLLLEHFLEQNVHSDSPKHLQHCLATKNKQPIIFCY